MRRIALQHSAESGLQQVDKVWCAPAVFRTGCKDWVHKESGAPVLKAQHPEFETWNQGTHARAGVACADQRAK